MKVIKMTSFWSKTSYRLLNCRFSKTLNSSLSKLAPRPIYTLQHTPNQLSRTKFHRHNHDPKRPDYRLNSYIKHNQIHLTIEQIVTPVNSLTRTLSDPTIKSSVTIQIVYVRAGLKSRYRFLGAGKVSTPRDRISRFTAAIAGENDSRRIYS